MFLHTVPYCILRLRKFVQLLSLHYTEVSVQIAGMASLAGAPYISVWEATDEEILQTTQIFANDGLIDGLENMADDNIYIFQGLVDTITPWCEYLLV